MKSKTIVPIIKKSSATNLDRKKLVKELRGMIIHARNDNMPVKVTIKDYNEFRDLSKKLLKKHANKLNPRRKGFLRSVKSGVFRANLLPTAGHREYLKKAHYATSSTGAIAKDWNNVGEDMWVSLSEILAAEDRRAG